MLDTSFFGVDLSLGVGGGFLGVINAASAVVLALIIILLAFIIIYRKYQLLNAI